MSESSDIFESEHQALLAAQTVLDRGDADAATSREALGALLGAYERLLRETRRLVKRSDRTELEMNQLNQRLRELAGELEYRATHDPLTGVLNRAAVIELSNRCLDGDALALIVLDIDYFKRINDSFGHPVGDQVICGVVASLKKDVSGATRLGRVGGEEFTVLLPAHALDEACAAAERMRQAIAAHAFGLPDCSRVTASFGVSWTPRGRSFDEAYGQADEALYAAKRAGRNRVMRAGPAR